MKTTALIVTYSNRFHLLKKVIEACFQEGVTKIIVIDNNSAPESKASLKDFQDEKEIKVIWNNSNVGSAKAFKIGLEHVLENKDHEYIWLLDDDNMPEKNSLAYLHDYWKKKSTDSLCLLSYRSDRNQYKKAIQSQNQNLIKGENNSFYGFSLRYKISSLFKKKRKLNKDINIGSIPYAPFGGMFFHKTLVNLIGYPNENYFLYSDDHEWSYRITQVNKRIQLLLKSRVKDIDKSWAIAQSDSVFKKISNGSKFRIYYTIRNRMFFEKTNLIKNRLEYFFNVSIFIMILFCYCGISQNFKIFLLAIKHANKKKLGKTFKNNNN